RLRAMDRDTLVAFYFHGRSLIEMSEKFDSPVGTIKRRLHTARKRLAEELESLATV
ncbi:MAG TPA: sigma factor-like helix-turn-helix DNA-binding protein, partial [Thermoguttaceae bacterium]|nr:sigma factor-like helix-turn-helix DNA-binding protein [Thermoguttaceae bacterium]